jgi:hypothetical protein
MSKLQAPTTTKAQFQVVLDLGTETNDDDQLAVVAAQVLDALIAEAAGLALGPVVGVDLDQRVVQVEMTVEAASASEAHQKLGLILGALERGTPLLLVQDSSASRARVDEPECEPVYA